MGFKASNIFSKAFIMKFVELFFVFIVFLLFRVGHKGDIFFWGLGPYPDLVPTDPPSTISPPNTTTTSSSPFQSEVKHEGFVYPEPYAAAPFMSERAENDLIFGVLTSVGYFFITIVLMIGIVMGDKQKYTMLLFNLFGFLFFISIGSEQINVYSRKDINSGKSRARGMGAMAILTSFTFLVDTVFSVMDVLGGDGE